MVLHHVLVTFMSTNEIFDFGKLCNQKISDKYDVSNQSFFYLDLVFLLFWGLFSKGDMKLFPHRPTIVINIFTTI